MCYYTQQGKTPAELTDFFNKNIDDPGNVIQSDFINGFAHPNLPIIMDRTPDFITTNFTWGLLPEGKDMAFRKNTLNARVETLDSKPSFAASIDNRCLVIVSAYYDWQWNDPSGKSKTKYQINSQHTELFCLGGIYNTWTGKDGQQWNTFSIVTTAANPTMKTIHNRRASDGEERMPIMFNPGEAQNWLDHNIHPLEYAYPNYKPELIAFPAN